jgi:hypothetical protein
VRQSKKAAEGKTFELTVTYELDGLSTIETYKVVDSWLDEGFLWLRYSNADVVAFNTRFVHSFLSSGV